MADSSKNIQKNQNTLTRQHKKSQNYYLAFLINTHISLPPPSPTPVFEGKGEMKLQKIWVGESVWKSKCKVHREL